MCDISMTMNNLGIFGNAFKGSYQINNFKSCEYPKNSGIEHLFEAGMWVGGEVRGEVRVTSTAMDNSRGFSTGVSNYEFTAPQSAVIREKSSLFNSRLFDPKAVSHQDFIMDFTDKNLVVPGTQIQIQNHEPIGIDVHLETYNWNYAFSNFFVILDYTITNNGNNPIDSMYIGMFANAVIRNTNITPAGSGGTSFYNKGGNGYNDSLYMGYTFDAAGDVGFTDSYFAYKFLGAESKNGFHSPRLDTTFKSHYNGWTWNGSGDPFLFSPGDDLARYKKMTSGLNHFPDWEKKFVPQLVTPGNRSDLVAVGPFRTVNPGETINIAFALVCGKKFDDGSATSENTAAQQKILIENAHWAETAYYGEDINKNGILDDGEDRDGNGKITRYVLPTPPNTPIVKFVPEQGKITAYWSNNSENSIDPISQKKDFAGYKLYLSQLGFDVQENISLSNSLKEVALWDKVGDSVFYETGFNRIKLAEPIYFDGDTTPYFYKYTIENLANGWQYAISLTSFDTGDEQNNLESLESSPVASVQRVFSGTPSNEDMESNEPFAYPNPYYLNAAWEGTSQRQTTKKMVFANLPANCVIRIYTTGNDLVKSIDHNSGEYTGEDIEWFNTFSDPEKTVFSGGEHAWDLLSEDGQTLARGVYFFSVKDKKNGKLYKGKFTIIR